MHQLNIALVTVGGLVLVLRLLSGPIRRSALSEPLVALLIGVLLGPRVLGLLDVAGWGRQELILEQAARLTLAVGLMGVALRLPKEDPIRRWRSLAVLLGLVMPLMWLASGLLVYLIVGLPFWVAMLAGAVVTPTDPIVSSAIVTGSVAEQNLPDDVRNTLSAESGANDGLAYPFVLLPILLLSRPRGEALLEWATRTRSRSVCSPLTTGYSTSRIVPSGCSMDASAIRNKRPVLPDTLLKSSSSSFSTRRSALTPMRWTSCMSSSTRLSVSSCVRAQQSAATRVTLAGSG